jgi:hypothetical protein
VSEHSSAEMRMTVERMERRLDASDDGSVVRLMDAYRGLIPRFESDLRDEHDVLLSRGAALMLVQAVASE